MIMYLLIVINIKLNEDAEEVTAIKEVNQWQYVSVNSSVKNTIMPIGKTIKQNNKSAIAKDITNFVEAWMHNVWLFSRAIIVNKLP